MSRVDLRGSDAHHAPDLPIERLFYDKACQTEARLASIEQKLDTLIEISRKGIETAEKGTATADKLISKIGEHLEAVLRDIESRGR